MLNPVVLYFKIYCWLKRSGLLSCTDVVDLYSTVRTINYLYCTSTISTSINTVRTSFLSDLMMDAMMCLLMCSCCLLDDGLRRGSDEGATISRSNQCLYSTNIHIYLIL